LQFKTGIVAKIAVIRREVRYMPRFQDKLCDLEREKIKREALIYVIWVIASSFLGLQQH